MRYTAFAIILPDTSLGEEDYPTIYIGPHPVTVRPEDE